MFSYRRQLQKNKSKGLTEFKNCGLFIIHQNVLRLFVAFLPKFRETANEKFKLKKKEDILPYSYRVL